MIRIAPYYERENRDEFQREYLRMVAASTPFLVEDVIFDDSEGRTHCDKAPKQRTRTIKGKLVNTTVGKLFKDHDDVQDRSDTEGKLLAEAILAEIVIREYSERLHEFLYEGQEQGAGHVNRENLRKLLLLRLPNGQIPDAYRFDTMRSGPQSEWTKRATTLYEYVFRYDEFSRLRPAIWHLGIHKLVEILDVKVCPYCNRLYTTTVSVEERRVRPQLDHFKSKSSYPFLALSINNLVPSCGVCNLLKGDDNCNLIYPYDENYEAEELLFRTNIPAEHTVPALEGIPISEQDFHITIEHKKPRKSENHKDHESKIQETIGKLCLDELYQSHRDYVAFLYRQRYILTKQLAQDLYNQFGELFGSVEEVEDTFALMYTDSMHWEDRPLAKLTHDILDEIEDLYRQIQYRR